jgi:hypothetical protein
VIRKQCDYCKQFVNRDDLALRGTEIDPLLACKTHPGCNKNADWVTAEDLVEHELIDGVFDARPVVDGGGARGIVAARLIQSILNEPAP